MGGVGKRVVLGQGGGLYNIFARGQMPPEIVIINVLLEERDEEKEEEDEER